RGPPSLAHQIGWWCCHRDRIHDAGYLSVWLILVVAAWALCGVCVHTAGAVRGSRWPVEDSPIPTWGDQAAIYFMGVLGGLFVPLLFTGVGAIRGRAASLWAGRRALGRRPPAADGRVGDRPGRVEPRPRKRRPKPGTRLMQPRAVAKLPQNRQKYF